MVDLTPLMDYLNHLGPWGVLIGIAVTVLVQRLRAKYPNLPLPAVTPSATPVRDAAKALLLLLLERKFSAPVVPAGPVAYAGPPQPEDDPSDYLALIADLAKR